jgi:hypothetical protein
MKHFTPELMTRLGSADPAVANAAAEWEQRLERYEHRLQQLHAAMPEHVRRFSDLLLHDADVLSLARDGDKLILALHKDIPPRSLVILTYALAGEPSVSTGVLPAEDCSPVMQFMYDELDLLREDGQVMYTQSILFSNGWELQLRFRDVQVVEAEPMYVANGSAFVPPAAPVVAEQA